MKRIQGITWRAFLIAISTIFVVFVMSGIYISIDTTSKFRKELENTNHFQAEKIEETLRTNLEQINRLAVGIGVSSDAMLFFASEYPDLLIDGFYSRIKNTLTAYAYSMKDTTATIMLFSWQDNKIMSNHTTTPYYLKDPETDLIYNAEWVNEITPLSGAERARLTHLYRKKGNTYPYVMTLIHQMRIDGTEAVVAIDIDLSKMYSVIASDLSKDTSVWVLSKDGQVLITEKKTALVQPTSEYGLLQFYDMSVKNKSGVVKNGTNSFAFSQVYLEDWEMYVVVATELGNIDHTLFKDIIRVIAVCLLATAIVILLVYVYTLYSSKPMRRVMEMVRNPNHVLITHPDEKDPGIREAAEYIMTQLQKNNNLLEELEMRMVSFRDAQLQALKAQINPHFLFNTLNNIIVLLSDDDIDPRAAQVTMNLSDVLRFALSDENLVLLRDELENAKKYIQILEVRYDGKFRSFFDVDDRLLDVKVPRLILQPLIENAVFHGLSAKEASNCELIIRCHATHIESANGIGNYICVDVTDNGAGMPQEKVDALMQSVWDESISMKNIGVQNVARRLRLLYPTDSNFEIKSEEGVGTTVSLTFPAPDILFEANHNYSFEKEVY